MTPPHRTPAPPGFACVRYEREGPLRGSGAPVVAVLLYRKHVVTEQPYIMQLIEQMEGEGVIPLPVFINGVEAHTVVGGEGGRGWVR